MVDTIELRLHDLNLHSTIERLLFKDGYEGKTKMLGYASLENNTLMETALRQHIVVSKEYDYTVNSMHWSDLKIKSSHYDLKFAINYEKDYIIFNVSVPKYLYGSNINQFVKSTGNNEFIFGSDLQFETQCLNLYDRLLKFIKYFFKREFVEVEIDYRYIEIRRLDICYNQIFETKEHALEYLELQKRIVKSRVQDKANYYRSYDTSVGYRTGSYYFKIYHKGAEYQKNDFNSHRKINAAYLKKQGFKYGLDKETLKKQKKSDYKNLIDTDFLQALSDRILRYEISFTTDRMSEIFNRKVYRQNSKEWRLLHSEFDKLHSRLLREGNSLHFTPEEKKSYKAFKHVLEKRRNFYPFPFAAIKLDTAADSADTQTITQAFFNKKLLALMLKDFKELFNQYQLDVKPKIEEVKDRIMKFNKEIAAENKIEKYIAVSEARKPVLRHEMSVNRILLFMSLLETKTMDEIKREKFFPKATFYRHVADMKVLGVERNAVHSFIEIVKSTDFEEYYNICHTYPLKMYINKDSYSYF